MKTEKGGLANSTTCSQIFPTSRVVVSTQLEKYSFNWIISPHRGCKYKTFELPPPSFPTTNNHPKRLLQGDGFPLCAAPGFFHHCTVWANLSRWGNPSKSRNTSELWVSQLAISRTNHDVTATLFSNVGVAWSVSKILFELSLVCPVDFPMLLCFVQSMDQICD